MVKMAEAVRMVELVCTTPTIADSAPSGTDKCCKSEHRLLPCPGVCRTRGFLPLCFHLCPILGGLGLELRDQRLALRK